MIFVRAKTIITAVIMHGISCFFFIIAYSLLINKILYGTYINLVI